MATTFKDFLVDTPNPKALDVALNQMSAALIGGPDNFVKVDGHYVMRALVNPDYVRFACEHQGYCKVLGETDVCKVGSIAGNVDEILADGQRNNVGRASSIVLRLFSQFAMKISEAEREDFFHPMNRSSWQGEFGRWLESNKGTND